MKFELLILIVTGFFILNVYNDGKYIALVKSWKKYYQMAFYAFLGLSLFIFVRKYPQEGKNLLKHANGFVKYMPIDKDSADMITPLFGATSFISKNMDCNNQQGNAQYNRMMNSGGNNLQNGSVGDLRTSSTTKRSVGETKKKFIASNQQWKCAHCNDPLTAWFEVDHKVRLEHGGDNSVNNLEALCRNCHGKKTAMESMI